MTKTWNGWVEDLAFIIASCMFIVGVISAVIFLTILFVGLLTKGGIIAGLAIVVVSSILLHLVWYWKIKV